MGGTHVDPEHTTGNDRALRAILDHHTALTQELERRVEDVLAAAHEGSDPDPARRALAKFLAGELLPHATADEQTLYPAAAREPRAELLVRAMGDEHRTLAEHTARLDTATDPIALAATAAAIQALFGVHVAKENGYLLPVLARGESDLAALLHDTHHLLAEGRDR
jgi:iron-sulfur cluster repair protein YtfE (RIC family)